MTHTSSTTPIEESFDRTIALLWPPHPGIWMRIALIALFLGGTMTNPIRTDDLQWGDLSGAKISSPEIISGNIDLIILVGIALFAAGLIYIIISAIFQFIFVDCLSSGRILLTRTLRIRWQKGIHLVGFYMILLFIIMIATSAVTMILIFPALISGPFNLIHMLILLIETLLLLLIILIPIWIIAILTADFVVPVMIVDNIGIIGGWRRIIVLFHGKWKEAATYTGLKLLLIVITGIILGITIFLISIPLGFVGTVLTIGSGVSPMTFSNNLLLMCFGTAATILISLLLLVPVITFFRYYSLVVLRNLDQEYNLLP